LWMLVMLVMVELKLWLGLMLLLDLWPRNLVRVEFGVGGRGGKVVRVRLARHGLGARVEDDDVALFKVLDEGMKVLEVETTTGVIAAELVFAFHGGEGVHDGASVRLYGGGHLACTTEVGRIQGPQELTGG
jgi:hypothetical protein